MGGKGLHIHIPHMLPGSQGSLQRKRCQLPRRWGRNRLNLAQTHLRRSLFFHKTNCAFAHLNAIALHSLTRRTWWGPSAIGRTRLAIGEIHEAFGEAVCHAFAVVLRRMSWRAAVRPLLKEVPPEGELVFWRRQGGWHSPPARSGFGVGGATQPRVRPLAPLVPGPGNDHFSNFQWQIGRVSQLWGPKPTPRRVCLLWSGRGLV